MININELNGIKDRILSGINNVSDEESIRINEFVSYCFNKNELNQYEVDCCTIILDISNILYNNSSNDVLPLDDGIYDLFLVMYKKYNENYLVGATPVQFEELPYESKQEIINPIIFIDRTKFDESFYLNEKALLRVPPLSKASFMKTPVFFKKNTTKKSVSIPHNYPKLVGTLEKCKFVMNYQPAERGLEDTSNVQIFERDFLGAHLQQGLFDPNTELTLIAELKYDGMSVEADVSDHVISARSRGDTANDIAADLTPILSGYPFYQAIGNVDPNEVFGMKFEAIITNDNLYKLGELRGKQYKNGRNAIIGLFGSLDGYLYRDLITLVPLATSIENIDRVTEIEFMNKFYHSGEMLRYAVLKGKYTDILYQVNQFVKEAEYMRSFSSFMYDGVVISYADKDIINKLGRSNSINKYSIAIKFNPMKKETIFLGYEFSVGQNGDITPIAHYKQIEFYGAIQTKSSVHSYKRFNDLSLRVGDIINVEYQNDVMSYITKSDNTKNDYNTNPIENFPEYCPSCGRKLLISASGKSAKCVYEKCPGRNIARMTNMLDKLNIKGFSQASIIAGNILSFRDLMNASYEQMLPIGEVNAQKFIDAINEFKSKPIMDYKLIGAIGFSNIAEAKWKLILSMIPIHDIVVYTDQELRNVLSKIKGIGETTIQTIIYERHIFDDDLVYIINDFYDHIILSSSITFKKSIRFSGIRDDELTERLFNDGYDISGTAGVTKNTDILIVPNYNYTSSKLNKISDKCIVVSLQDFKADPSKYLM